MLGQVLIWAHVEYVYEELPVFGTKQKRYSVRFILKVPF